MIAVLQPANRRRGPVEVDSLRGIENVIDRKKFLLGVGRKSERQHKRQRNAETIEQRYSPTSLSSFGINFLMNGTIAARTMAAAKSASVVAINSLGIWSNFSGST